MSKHLFKYVFTLTATLLSLSFVAAQDLRQFFKKPETALEYWAAMKFEIEVGKYDIAASHLKGFLEKMPTDEELLQLETKEGISAFLKLLTIPDSVKLPEKSFKDLKTDDVPDFILAKLKAIADKEFASERDFWDAVARILKPDELKKYQDKIAKQVAIFSMRKDAGPLVERVSLVVQKMRGDPERIKKFVKNLSATPEERAYAIAELRRSGAIAIPYILEVLLEARETDERLPILTALQRLNKEVVPPLLAALEMDNSVLVAELIDVIRLKADVSAVPGLWYYSAAPKQPDFVRQRATNAISVLLSVEPDKLPPAKAALTAEANRYYLHKIRYTDPKAVVVWQWDSMAKKLTVPAAKYTQTQAEEYYGLRYARQALDIDPTYKPAQIVFLSMAIDKATERAGIDQQIDKGSPVIKDLLRSVNPSLLTAVLDRALTEKRLPVILGSVRTLGDLTEINAARPQVNQPSALVRCLNFPDRRVQMAAADAILRMPEAPAPLSKARIVEILRRAVSADAVARALIADFNDMRGQEVAKAVKEAGFEPVVVRTGREVMRRLSEAADIDILLVDQALPDPGVVHLLSQLRGDIDSGLLPIIITLAPDKDGQLPIGREEALRRILPYYRNVWLMPTAIDAEVYKKVLFERVAESMGRPLTEEERKNHAGQAIVWLKRMATGELAGYDLRPAETAILRTVRHSEELRGLAIEALGGLPGAVPQRELAALVLDKNNKPEFRAAAAIELNRHIQQHGVAITKGQMKEIQDLFATVDDPKLKGNVALVIGSMRPGAARTGARLQGYAPPPPPPPAEEEKKEDKKEEKKEEKKEDK